MADLIHVKGLAELDKFLQELPVKMEKNVLRGALRAGMKVVLPVARANINSVSGQLAAGLKLSTNTRGGTVTASIKAKGKHGFLASFVEYGTRAHLISVQEAEKRINVKRSIRLGRTVRESMSTINRGVLRIGRTFVGPTVSHPGATPHPFLRPALDSQAQNAVMAAGEYIKKRLETKHGIDTSDVVIEGNE